MATHDPAHVSSVEPSGTRSRQRQLMGDYRAERYQQRWDAPLVAGLCLVGLCLAFWAFVAFALSLIL